MADEPNKDDLTMEPTTEVVDQLQAMDAAPDPLLIRLASVAAIPGPVLPEHDNGPTTLAMYWKLDAWNQGYVVALEAGFEASEVAGQSNPYPGHSHDGQQWGTGHLSGRIAGHV